MKYPSVKKGQKGRKGRKRSKGKEMHSLSLKEGK